MGHLEERWMRTATAYGADSETAQRWWQELTARDALEDVDAVVSALPDDTSPAALAAAFFRDAEVASRALTELGFPADAIAEATRLREQPRFGARKATVFLIAYLGAQALAAIVAMILITGWLLLRGTPSDQVTAAATDAFLMPALILGVLAGGAVIAMLLTTWGRPFLHQPGVTGFGFRRGTSRQQLLALATGLTLAAAWMLTTTFILPVPDDIEYGPVAKLAMQGGLARILWALLAIVAAPAIEEVLFRGVLLAGYTKRFGLPAATFLTTLIFVALHLTEIWSYPLAALPLTMLALLTTYARVRTDSIAIAAILHCAYNATLAAGVAALY